MHLGTAQLLFAGHLASGRHQQRWACQEGARALSHHDDHITEPRHVGAAGRTGAVLNGDDGNACRRQASQVAKQGTAMDKALDPVTHQVGPGAFDQVDKRQLVLQGDLLHAQDFFQAHGLDGAGLNA